MRWALLSIVAVAGCSFRPDGAELDAGDTDGEPGIDADETDGAPAIDAAIDAPAVATFCNASDPDLRACFTFAGGTVTNGAGTTLSINTQNVGSTIGRVGEGIALTDSSVIHIAETAALDLVGPYTFEAFVKVGMTPPATGRAGVYDENGELGIFINDQRQIYCTNGPVFGPVLALDTWTHIACVYDRANVMVYVGGALFAMTPMTGDLNIATTDGGNLGQDCRAGGTSGDPLSGALDEVRIWASARSAVDIAAAAGR
jgi:hypothetical protein